MYTITKAPLETIAVDQCHEKLEVFFLAVVWRGCHEQKMSSKRRKQLPKNVALGVLDFSTEKRSRHLVRFIAYNKVPPAIWGCELGLNVIISRKFIEPCNDKVVFHEPVASTSSLQFVVRENLEG